MYVWKRLRVRYAHDPMVSFMESLKRCRLGNRQRLQAAKEDGQHLELAEGGQESYDTCGPHGPPLYRLRAKNEPEALDEEMVPKEALV